MVKALDLVGKKFGRLTVVSRSDSDKHGKTRWNCICDCGIDCIINGSCLKSGHTKSCGCLKKNILNLHLLKTKVQLNH